MKFAAMIAVVVSISSCGAAKKTVTNQVAQNYQTSQTYQKNTEVSSSAQSTTNIPEQQMKVSKAAQNAIDSQGPVSIDMIDFGFGRSGDRAKALRDALKSAQNNIAIRLYRTLSAVDKEFAEDITLGDKITSKTKRSDMIIGVIDRKTATISYTSAPTFSRENGVYEYQVEVKLTPTLLQSITKEIYNSLPDKDELKVKSDEKEFYDEVYTKVIDDYRTTNGNNK